MREIKFRAWDTFKKILFEFPMNDYNTGDFFCDEDGRFIVEQFTGLHDKNGIPIFEGDVVQYEPKCNPTEVFYDHYIGAWQPFAATHYPVTDWELLGNVHENPELLKP